MKLAVAPFGSRRYLHIDADYSVPARFRTLLNDPTAPRVFLLDAAPYDPVGAGTVEVGFSSGASAPIFGGRYWPARLDAAINSDVDLFSGEILGSGGSLPGFGSISVLIGDGDHDALAGYRWDGRDVAVLMGGEDFTLAEFGVVFRGTAEDITYTENDLSIVLRDYSSYIDKPVQSNLYAGSGGLEGGADLQGQPKPLAYGPVRNVEPVRVDVPLNVYQIHDGALAGIDAVYDRAVALTSAGDVSDVYTWTPVPGYYVTDLADGVFRLGAPPDGPVTADARGDSTGGYVSSAADIIKRIVTTRAGLAEADIDLAGIAATNLANDAACGVYVQSGGLSVPVIIDDLMRSIGGWWTFTRDRQLLLGVLQFSAAVATLDAADIHSIRRDRTPLPVWRRRVGYAQSWRVQQTRDVSTAGASTDRQAFVGSRFRYAVAEDSAIQTRRALARDTEVPALLDVLSRAQAEADRQLALLGADRDIFEVEVSGWQFRLRPGQTVQLDYPRWSLNKPMVIIGLAEVTATRATTLRLWG